VGAAAVSAGISEALVEAVLLLPVIVLIAMPSVWAWRRFTDRYGS
jgi:hypothetical protein